MAELTPCRDKKGGDYTDAELRALRFLGNKAASVNLEQSLEDESNPWSETKRKSEEQEGGETLEFNAYE